MNSKWLFISASVSIFLMILISLPAWYPGMSDYPKIPAFSFFDPDFPRWIQYLLFFILAGSLLFILPEFTRKMAATVFIITVSVLVLEDINRLQPWLWMHGLLLLFWSFSKTENIFGITRWALVCMYAWSGIYKFNLNFAWEVFPFFMNAFGLKETFYLPVHEVGDYSMPLINHLAWSVPLAELLVAVLLCTKWQRQGIYLAVFLHLVILFILGPLGLNWNEVVWVWNVLLIALLIVLLLSGEQPRFSFVKNKKVWNSLPVIVFGVLPVFWLFGWMPNNLSFHLYSGQNAELRFYMPGINEEFMDPEKAEWTFFDPERNESVFWADHYAISVNHIPVFAEEKYMKQTGLKLCDCYGYSGNNKAGIIMAQYSYFGSRRELTRISCPELEKLR